MKKGAGFTGEMFDLQLEERAEKKGLGDAFPQKRWDVSPSNFNKILKVMVKS